MERRTILRIKLTGWANQMVMRFGPGTAVYLVGSGMHTHGLPKDTDIAIVLPDTLFAMRYGGIERDWPSLYDPTEPPPGAQRFMQEVSGLVPGLCSVLLGMAPPDLKVQSETASRAHVGPRLLLNNLRTTSIEAKGRRATSHAHRRPPVFRRSEAK